MHTTWTLVKISREHSTGDRKLNFSNSRLWIHCVHWIHLNFKETVCFLFFPLLSLEMTAVLIKSKLLNVVASGRESLFREDASCERPGNAGPPRGGRAERGSPRARRSINYPARLCSGQQPYRSPAFASRYQSSDNDICVDSLYNNPNFPLRGSPLMPQPWQRCIPCLRVAEDPRHTAHPFQAQLSLERARQRGASTGLMLKPRSVTKIHRAQLVLRPQRSGLSQSWTEQTLRSFTHQNF